MNYLNVEYPNFEMIQRTEYSKLNIHSPFEENIYKNIIVKDYEKCIPTIDNNFFTIDNNSISWQTATLEEQLLSYIFIPKYENIKILKGDDSFKRAQLTHIDTIFIPENIKIMFPESLMDSSLKYLYIPKTVTDIGYNLLNGSDIQQIIYDSKCDIPENCFTNCVHLNDVKLNDEIECILKQAFFNCINLTNIKLPQKLFEIGDGAFQNTKLEKITLPKSLESIDVYAFAYTNIKELYIPKSVCFIGHNAFSRCPLENIIIEDISNLELETCSLESSKHCKITIKENNKKYAKKWIEENKDAFNNDCEFEIIDKEKR